METSSKINRSQRLFIELGTSLLMEPSEPERAVSCELIGMQVGKYLIVQLSDLNWKKGCVKKNEQVQVKYISSNDVFGFSSKIITTLKTPDFLIFLTYPENVDSCSVRSQKRVDCFLPVTIKKQDKTVNAIIININQNGCLCSLDKETALLLDKDDQITIHLSYGEFDSISIASQVRGVQKNSSQTKIGIKFDGINNFTKQVFSTLVPSLNV
jgi:c-di-GMP-binding flagellar brake protein YcgR